MRFVKIGNTRWINVGIGHIVGIEAHAGHSIVKLSTGAVLNDDRTPEALIFDLGV